MGFLFFLSYARTDDDIYVQQFYHDLSAEVRAYAGLHPRAEVGFLDRSNLEMGAEWEPRLLEALAECRTFVALLSPRYVVSEPCGREWTVFAERLQRYEADVEVRPPALIPVQWLIPRRLPTAVERRQYDNDQLPPAYRELGLRQLIRLQKRRDAYLELLAHLARRIVDTAEHHPIPNGSTDRAFSEVPNAFAPSAPRPTAVTQPHQVHFLVAAPTSSELSGVDLGETVRIQDYYGGRSRDWAPYRPEAVEPLALRACTVAQARQFASSVSDLPAPGHAEMLSLVDGQVIVLLVDVWAARLASYREALAQLSHRDDSLAAVMVPSNHSDRQTRAEWPRLLPPLRTIFLRRAVDGDVAALRTGILSHDAFDADLGVVLETARNQTLNSGTARRPMPDDPGPPPTLDGP